MKKIIVLLWIIALFGCGKSESHKFQEERKYTFENTLQMLNEEHERSMEKLRAISLTNDTLEMKMKELKLKVAELKENL